MDTGEEIGTPLVVIACRSDQRAYTCYSMLMLTRRLQILIDEERYERLERAAEKGHRSVAAAIREAIDLAYPSDTDEKARAAAVILSAPQIAVPDVAELKAELETIRSGEL
jgi:hypothetical protein